MCEEVLRAKLRSFMSRRFPMIAARQIADDDSLIDSGMVDSLGILELVTFLDSELGIQLADHELSPENFGSLTRLSSFLASKQSA
jgi:acyl carrier protein